MQFNAILLFAATMAASLVAATPMPNAAPAPVANAAAMPEEMFLEVQIGPRVFSKISMTDFAYRNAAMPLEPTAPLETSAAET